MDLPLIQANVNRLIFILSFFSFKKITIQIIVATQNPKSPGCAVYGISVHSYDYQKNKNFHFLIKTVNTQH